MNEYVLKIEISQWEVYTEQESQGVDRRLYLRGGLTGVERDSGGGMVEKSTVGDHDVEDTETRELQRNIGGRDISIEVKERISEEMEHIIGIVMPKPDEEELRIVIGVTTEFLNDAIAWCMIAARNEENRPAIALRILGIGEPWNSDEDGLGVLSARLAVAGEKRNA